VVARARGEPGHPPFIGARHEVGCGAHANAATAAAQQLCCLRPDGLHWASGWAEVG
jgi:hypothetical protein